MPLTLRKCKAHIDHALGGSLPPALSYDDIVNQAGEYLTTLYPWKWLENNEAKLNLRANVTATGLNFVTGTDGLDKLSHGSLTPFLGYQKVTGDLVEVTGGTNVNLGFYAVESGGGTGEYLFVAAQPLLNNTPETISTTGGALGNNDIACTIHTNRVSLPKDFRELIAINATSGLMKGVQLTSYADLLEKKAVQFTSSGFYWAAVCHARDQVGTNTAANGANTAEPVTPSLEIWPTPAANETGALTIYYRSGWPHDLFTPADQQNTTAPDSMTVRIPRYLEAFFIELVRTFAKGYMESEVAGLSERLAFLNNSPLFLSAVDRDGSVQGDLGPIINGAAQRDVGGNPFSNFNSVAGPS